MASRTFLSVSSLVAPVAMQPGKSGEKAGKSVFVLSKGYFHVGIRRHPRHGRTDGGMGCFLIVNFSDEVAEDEAGDDEEA